MQLIKDTLSIASVHHRLQLSGFLSFTLKENEIRWITDEFDWSRYQLNFLTPIFWGIRLDQYTNNSIYIIS